MSAALADDFDTAHAEFGLWYDGKMAETTGSGKNIAPKYDPYALLGIPRPNARQRSVPQLRGVGSYDRSAPAPSPEPPPRPPWVERTAED